MEEMTRNGRGGQKKGRQRRMRWEGVRGVETRVKVDGVDEVARWKRGGVERRVKVSGVDEVARWKRVD